MSKSLKGFLKSRHFQERQKQRNISDEEIIQALIKGTLSETDQGQVYTLGHLRVIVNMANDTLITAHPGDPSTTVSKVLSKDHAKKIRARIESMPQSEEETNEFLKYVKENAVKKI